MHAQIHLDSSTWCLLACICLVLSSLCCPCSYAAIWGSGTFCLLSLLVLGNQINRYQYQKNVLENNMSVCEPVHLWHCCVDLALQLFRIEKSVLGPKSPEDRGVWHTAAARSTEQGQARQHWSHTRCFTWGWFPNTIRKLSDKIQSSSICCTQCQQEI